MPFKMYKFNKKLNFCHVKKFLTGRVRYVVVLLQYLSVTWN